MKNADLFHFAYSIAVGSYKNKKKHVSFDLFRSYMSQPNFILDRKQRTLTIELEMISSEVIGIGAVQQEYNKFIENMGFETLLPVALEAFELDKKTLFVASGVLKAQAQEQLNAVDRGDCDCDDVQISFKHSIVYKIASASKEKELLAIMKRELNNDAEYENQICKVIPLKLATAFTFKLSQGDQVFDCYIDRTTQKVGFAGVFNTDGSFKEQHNATWELWKDPTFDVRPLLDQMGSTQLKSALKAFLADGVKMSDCKLYTHDCSYLDQSNAHYKQITIKANLGSYYNPMPVFIQLKKRGKVTITNMMRQDISDHPKCKLLADHIEKVRPELFKNNQDYASMFLINSTNNCNFRSALLSDWQNPFSEYAATLYFR